MNDYGAGGFSSSSFERWIQRSDDSTMAKMEHQYWVTKQTLSQKLGKKQDECIVASDAELDAKLELFRSIQESCTFLQRVIDKYQERLCNLAQEGNAMGRFLKDAGKYDNTRAGKVMSVVGKSVSYSAQQQLTLRGPLIRLYQEVETFRQRAIEDTLQNVQAMEKARIEYRAALSWMKNISQELDPDTTRQLKKFRKVQAQVKRGKANFDNLALDCLQKVDLLAAARCNMFSHALVLYQSTLLNYTKKSVHAYSAIANSFKGYQVYDFLVVKELSETSAKLAKETAGPNQLNDKDEELLFLDENQDVEEADEAVTLEKKKSDQKKQETILDLDFGTEDLTKSLKDCEKEFFECMKNLDPLNKNPTDDKNQKTDLSLDSLSNWDMSNFLKSPDASEKAPKTDDLSIDDDTFFSEILNRDRPSTAESEGIDWKCLEEDTFLPPGILKQSLGNVTLGTQKQKVTKPADETKSGKDATSWLDLFAELDPLASNSIERLTGSNADV